MIKYNDDNNDNNGNNTDTDQTDVKFQIVDLV